MLPTPNFVSQNAGNGVGKMQCMAEVYRVDPESYSMFTCQQRRPKQFNQEIEETR